MSQSNTFYIETYGCTSNKADSNIISNLLKQRQYNRTNINKARFIIINTCAVKEQTENKIKSRLKRLYRKYGENQDKEIIITGCLPHITSNYIDIIKDIVPNFAAIVDMNSINQIPEILEKIKNNEKNLIYISSDHIDKSEFCLEYDPNKINGIVPISEGCLGSCTYCCVKNARGRLTCFNPTNVINNVKHQLSQGVKQIYLTSQDCSTYEYEGTQLVDIIREINGLNFQFFLRIGMINPRFLIDHLDQIESIMRFEHVYQFLHIPIQSGSDKILQKMNRPYRISDIIEPLDFLRKRFPYLSISTDIICGFPGETEYDFYKTINFIKWLRPEILNISKFTARPGTKAKQMDQVNSKVIKNRSLRLSKVFRNSFNKINEKWNGWGGEVLLLHKGTQESQAFARNFAYKNIFIENYQGSYGVYRKVKVYEVDGFNLMAKLEK